MARKEYQKPLSLITRVQTEQGICYSSGENAEINPQTTGDINVEQYKEIDNDIEFQ